MAIIGRQGLEYLLRQGILAVSGHLPVSAFSIDIRLGRLFRSRYDLSDDISQEEFLDLVEEIQIPEEGIVITPHDFYVWTSKEEIFIPRGLGGEITSRSSFARMGCRVEDADDYLRRFHDNVWTSPLSSLKTSTSLLLRKNDPLAQLFICYPTASYFEEDVLDMVSRGDLLIQRNGQRLSSDAVAYLDGIPLTMDKEIWLYRGGVIKPGFPTQNNFEKINVDKPLFLPRGAFFISASQESVELPDYYVGYVSESGIVNVPLEQLPRYVLPFRSHAHAPYIGPKSVFRGKITFENTMKRDGYVYPGMTQSRLVLFPLFDLGSAEKSVYNLQEGAALSKY